MAKDMLIDGNNKTVKYILIGIVVTVVIYILYQIYKASQTAGNAAGEIASSAIIQAQTGISKDRQAVCKQVANDCRDATTFWLFTKYPAWVNSAKFSSALNRLLNANEAILASEYFRQIAGTSLKSIADNTGVFTMRSYINVTILNALT